MQDVSNYENIRVEAQQLYQQIGAIRCSALDNEFVHFTAEGFNHLIYKGSRSERSRNDQITRFRLLPKAREIIYRATLYQEYDESLIEIRRRRFKRTVTETTTVRYWGLVGIINRWRVKVIVRQIGNGQLHFWSVIPAWSTGEYHGIRVVSLAKGNPADD